MLNSDLETAPQWVADLCRTKRPRKADTREPLIELDSQDSIHRARAYLAGAAPEAQEGAGGDHTTYAVAAAVREFGISESLCLELMWAWNETKAHPPWAPDELEQKVANAYRYATGAWGGASALAEFDVVEVASGLSVPIAKKPGMYFVPFNEAALLAGTMLATPLIKGLLDVESMCVLYGISNSGKTFVALDLSFHIAAGLPWQGRKVTQGLVVYVAAEGGRGIYKRIAALKKHFGVEDCALAVVPCHINLREAGQDVKALIGVIREAEAMYGMPCVLVVIDTLSRALAGGEENGSVDMGAFVKNVDRIRGAVKAAMLIVHHSGKDTARGARGHSLLRAATDTEIEIDANTIKVTKQRDLDAIKELKFELVPVQVAESEDGPITSCVVRVLTGTEFMAIELSPEAQNYLDAYHVALLQKKIDNPDNFENYLTTEQWDEAYISIYRGGQTRGFSAKSLQRCRTEVVTGGHLRRVNNNQWVK